MYAAITYKSNDDLVVLNEIRFVLFVLLLLAFRFWYFFDEVCN